jgi:hypothetical protein
MKYQIGDTVAFDVPIGTEGKAPGAKPGRQRFHIGLIRAVLETHQAYQIASLVGKAYLVSEAQISGRTQMDQGVLTGNWGFSSQNR